MNLVQEIKAGIETQRDASTSLYPSSCNEDACPLRDWYRIHEVPVTNSPPPENQWKLAFYGTHEEYVGMGLAKREIEAIPQVVVKFGNWSGRVDFEIDPAIPVEVKSVNPFAFSRPYMPYTHHIQQLITYMVLDSMLDEPRGWTTGCLVYVERWLERWNLGRDTENIPQIDSSYYATAYVTEPSRGVPAMLQFDITPTQEEIDEVTKLMRGVESLVDRPQPRKPYDSPTEHRWNCEYRGEIRCPYYDRCWINPF